VSSNKKNFLLENNIHKDYFNNSSYLKDKIRLTKTIKNIYINLDKKKDTFHVLSKNFIFDFDKTILKKFIKYKTVIVIGIGGSALGVRSIYSFLKHKIRKNFIFLDNLDESKIEIIIKKKKLKNNLFIIISKSGNTLETLINSSMLKDKISPKNTIVITEEKNNLLNNFAKRKKITHITHKNYIGGRYAVLSEVGMIPAYFMDLKIKNFRKDLLSFFKSKQNLILVESIVKLAHIHNSKKI
jgi:glucose-6-phosphate isomerase